MTDSRSWPELGEELARKALTVLQDALHDFSEGNLSSKETRIVINTLVDTIQGLAPAEVTNMILKVREELDG